MTKHRRAAILPLATVLAPLLSFQVRMTVLLAVIISGALLASSGRMAYAQDSLAELAKEQQTCEAKATVTAAKKVPVCACFAGAMTALQGLGKLQLFEPGSGAPTLLGVLTDAAVTAMCLSKYQ